jgi:hypothetical protein
MIERTRTRTKTKSRPNRKDHPMKAWLERIRSWVKVGPSTTHEGDEEEEREYREQEEEAPLPGERRNRPGETDGFRGVVR